MENYFYPSTQHTTSDRIRQIITEHSLMETPRGEKFAHLKNAKEVLCWERSDYQTQ